RESVSSQTEIVEKIAVVKCRYEVTSTKIKKSLLKAEIITWDSLEHEVSMRPAYRSSKKVKDYDKLEAEVKKNRRMISLKETLL
ncbi:hypothetical protein IGI04_002205, partial [Brassica rapa subsp. trilocularis]